MNDLLVIGLDAQFADQASIDRFDRCVFLGKAVNAASHQPADWIDLCARSLERLVEANAVDAGALQVVLVAGQASAAELQRLGKPYAAVHHSLSLPLAMQQAITLADGNMPVALVAANVVSVLDAHASASISFDRDFKGYGRVQGVAGILLGNTNFASRQGAYVYATIKGFSAFPDVATACAQALNDSSFTVNDVKYLEVSALADFSLAQQEMAGLIKGYNTDKTLETAVGGLRSVTGDGGAFSQVAGLVKAVIAVHQRYFPGNHDWQAPAAGEWCDSPFYFPIESRPWFPNSNGKPLVAAYSCMTGLDYCHIVLQENQQDTLRTNGYLACSELVLVPLVADSQQDLLLQLDGLEKQLDQNPCLQALAREYYEISRQAGKKYTLSLLAESAAELRKEIDLAREGVSAAFASLHEWKTPKGSFFAPEPIDHHSNVAFLYPGIGATYIGLGQEIFHLFPEIYRPVADLADDIASSLKDRILNPRTLARPSFAETKQMDHDLRTNLPDIAECGVGFACVFTKIFENVFRMKADFAAGYSMGEISMYAALGCWKRPGEMSSRLARSDTFNHRLTGRLDTLRHHWGLPDARPGESEKLWETYTLKATPEEVAEACEDEDRVYCTIINTPDSLVIGGYPEACERVIKKLGVRGMALDIQNAIHSEPAFKEYESMEQLFTMESNDRLETRIYSSSCYLPVPQRSKAIANSIAKCLCDPVDFPRLINTVYDKGARVFIEMGPGRSLCSWVDKILKHDDIKPHVSVPVNAKGVSDELTLVRAVAKLLSHGIRMDISTLYYGSLVKRINAPVAY